MSIVHKLNRLDHNTSARGVILEFGGLLFFSVIIFFVMDNQSAWLVLLAVWVFSIITCPGLIIYFQYLILSRGLEVEISKDDRTIVIRKEGQIEVLSFDEVEQLVYVHRTRSSFALVAATDFWYYLFEFKNQRALAVTNLMSRYISNTEFKRTERVVEFPTVRADGRQLLNRTVTSINTAAG